MQKIWKAKLDGRKWSFNKICNEILNEREIFNLDRFLYPIEEDMLPFEDFKNIKEGAFRVVESIRNKKSFFVYYDTDV